MDKKTLLRASAIPAAAFLAGILLGTTSSRHPAPPRDGADPAPDVPSAAESAPATPDGVAARPDGRAPGDPPPPRTSRAAEARREIPLVPTDVRIGPAARHSGKAVVSFRLDEPLNRDDIVSNVLPHVSVSAGGVPLRTTLDSVGGHGWRRDTVVWLGLLADAPVTNATVSFAPGLRGAARAPLGQALEETVSYEPATIAIETTGSEVREFANRATPYFRLSADADLDSLREHLRVSPEPDGGWTLTRRSNWSPSYTLTGAFRPDAKYELSLRPGVVAPDGLPFALSTNAVPLRTLRAPAALELLSKGHYLTPRDRIGVAFRTQNAPHATVSLARVLPQNIGELARRCEGDDRRPWWDESFVQNDSYDLTEHPSLHTRTVVASAPAPDAVVTNVLPLADFADPGVPLRGGAYLLGIKATDTNDTGAATCSLDRLVVISDVGLQVRRAGHRVEAFAGRLSTGRPLADATLSFFAANGALLATLPADAQGRATYAEPDTLHLVHLVSAALPDGDWTFLRLAAENEVDESVADAPADTGRNGYPASEFALAGALFSDRGIYRHGEPVRLEALVRVARTGRAPDPLPLDLEIRRPDDVLESRLRLVSDARGRLAPAAPWVVPEGQPSGRWKAVLCVPESAAHGATCILAERAFSVEEFAPPQIRAQILDLPESVPAGATNVAFKVQGDYFFGSPAAGRPARARVSLRNAPFRPAGWDEKRWSFGPAATPDEILEDRAVGAGALDDAGSASFSFDPADTRAAGAPGPVRAVVEAGVDEPGGRRIAARAATTLHMRPWYVGVGAGEAAPGEAWPVDLALVAPDGSVAADAAPALSLRLCAIRHSYEYERDSRGRWIWRDKRWEDVVCETNAAVAAGRARVVLRIPDDPARYVVHAVAAGPDGKAIAATDREFGAWGDEARERSLAGPARLTLSPDRKSYAPGDTARIEIRAPFPGVARVVLRRDTVLQTRLVETTNGTATVSFYVEPSMAPGFEVAATVVRPVVPEAEWGPHRACGAVAVRVEDPARALAPTLDAPAVSFKDGRATVAARVSLPAGADPAAARATFFLVDEAVLELTGEKTPDPMKALFPGYRSWATLWDTYAALLRVFDGPYAKTATIGGDGLGGLLSRLSPVTSRRFKPLALAAQDVAFGADGAATATFDVGAFTGEVRLTALVWTDRAAGAASARAKVAPALVVQPDAPRFLAPGDSTKFTVAVHNTTADRVRVYVDASFKCGNERFDHASYGPTIAQGGSKTFRLSVTLPADAPAGNHPFRVRVDGAGETNRVEFEIPVRPPVAARTVTETVALAPGAVWTNVPPAGFLPGTETLRVSLEPNPAVQALPALRYLTFYPHGCCEQTTSAVFPLVWAQGALLSFAERGEELPGDPEAKIRAAIARLGTMARGDSFAMWPDVSYSNPSDSLRAAHFLVEAARAGFDVPEGLRRTALSAARRALRVGPDDLRARASLVLVAAGAPDETWLLRLLDRRPGLSPAARAQLAIALAAAGRPKDAIETLRAIPAAPARKDGSCWWDDDRGAVEDAAWGVIAWLAMPSDDALAQASALYARLLALRPDWADGHWGWTSVNADALLATASLLRRTGGSDRAAARRFPEDVAAVTNDAAGVRFLVRAARGLPATETVGAETNGLVVSRTFLTREGKPLDPTGADEAAAIRQGDTIAVAIDLALVGERDEISDLVIQELLPAGLEIVSVGKDARLPWAAGDTHDWLLRSDVRDDRLLAFSRTVAGTARLVYLAQAVSPGDYVLPGLSVEGMYDPLVRGTTAPGRLKVLPALHRDADHRPRRR